MADTYIWLSISLFCERDRWHILLQDGIRAFLKYEATAGIVALEIVLSYERGENIRCSILTSKKDADNILLKADRHFKTLFSQLPAGDLSAHEKIPSNSFFRPFPPNTIQYGVYKMDPLTEKIDFRHYRFIKWLSIYVTEALNEPVDFSTVLTVAVYLHISMLAALRRHSDLSVEKYLSAYFKAKNRKYYDDPAGTTVEDQAIFESQYGQNITFFHEIKDQIDNPNSWNRDLLWLKKCHRLLVKEVDRQLLENLTPQVVYIQLTNIIQRQLGYNKEMQSLLNLFISKIYTGKGSENVLNA